MDRRYYGLKALVVLAAFCVAYVGSGVEAPRQPREPMQTAHYQAASLMQTSLQDASQRITHSLTRFFSCLC